MDGGSFHSRIWSCLAGHVAVLHLDGIRRRPLARKLTGVFDCSISRRSYQIVHGFPTTWAVPHSRLNGLPVSDLASHGYAVLSSSRDVGADIFCRQHDALQLFFQGHPEYDPEALIGEYRRDVKRYLNSSAQDPPPIPRGCFTPKQTAALEELYDRALRAGSPDLAESFDAVIRKSFA